MINPGSSAINGIGTIGFPREIREVGFGLCRGAKVRGAARRDPQIEPLVRSQIDRREIDGPLLAVIVKETKVRLAQIEPAGTARDHDAQFHVLCERRRIRHVIAGAIQTRDRQQQFALRCLPDAIAAGWGSPPAESPGCRTN